MLIPSEKKNEIYTDFKKRHRRKTLSTAKINKYVSIYDDSLHRKTWQ